MSYSMLISDRCVGRSGICHDRAEPVIYVTVLKMNVHYYGDHVRT